MESKEEGWREEERKNMSTMSGQELKQGVAGPSAKADAYMISRF